MSSTTSAYDGWLEMWVNGVLTTRYSDVRLSDGFSDLQWDRNYWDAVWGGNTPDAPADDQWQQIDQWYIATN